MSATFDTRSPSAPSVDPRPADFVAVAQLTARGIIAAIPLGFVVSDSVPLLPRSRREAWAPAEGSGEGGGVDGEVPFGADTADLGIGDAAAADRAEPDLAVGGVADGELGRPVVLG